MYNASGTASTMQITVTSRATPIVRKVGDPEHRVGERLDDVVGGERVHHRAGEAVGTPERRNQQHRKRSQIGHHQPGHRRDQQERQADPASRATPRCGVGPHVTP